MLNTIFFYRGLFGIAAQLIIFREISFLFYCNELFLGSYLALWLFWVGVGSFFIKRFLKNRENYRENFARSFFALAVLLPVEVLSIRASKSGFAFGSLVSPLGATIFIVLALCIFCFVLGCQFYLACALIFRGENIASVLGRVYRFEALGSVVGGALFSFFIIGMFPLFIAALMLSFMCIFCALVLTPERFSVRNLCLAFGCFCVIAVSFQAEKAIGKIQWRGYSLIYQRETRNANLAVANLGSIRNIFVDGALLASYPAPENDEPAAHWPLLAAGNTEKILIAGESGIGLLKEALKYNPRYIDYVVLDKAFIETVKPYLEKEDILALEDARVRVHYVDARLFVKKGRLKYDAIILNAPEVNNLKQNRLYTREFYRDIKLMLNPYGIFGQSVASSENYLSKETRSFNASVSRTVKSVFSNVEVIPGDNIIFLASTSNIDLRQEIILGRFYERKIPVKHINPAYLTYKLEPLRRAELRKILDEEITVRINYDFYPVAYYYFNEFWRNKFSRAADYFFMGIIAVFLSRFVFKRRKKAGQREYVGEHVLLFIFGFISILLELALIFAFQIVSGIVYWQMGTLFSAFMLGLFIGSAVSANFKDNSRRKVFLCLLAAGPLIMVLTFCSRYFFLNCAVLSSLENTAIFSLLLMFIGALSGGAFVLCGFLMPPNASISSSGALYSADLWGAALGAILAGNFIIPRFGLLSALNISAAAVFIGLIIFTLSKRGLLQR